MAFQSLTVTLELIHCKTSMAVSYGFLYGLFIMDLVGKHCPTACGMLWACGVACGAFGSAFRHDLIMAIGEAFVSKILPLLYSIFFLNDSLSDLIPNVLGSLFLFALICFDSPLRSFCTQSYYSGSLCRYCNMWFSLDLIFT